MRKRSRSPHMQSTLQRVMDLRGYQRFYYHVHTVRIDHRWDHEDALNHVQRELEATFGGLLVELIAVREWPADDGKICLCLYYRIGPLPSPDVHFPVRLDRPSEMRL
jgi:hypothetical protein